MGSLMAVLMSTSTILGSCPAPVFAVADTTEVKMDASTVNANDYGLVSATEGNILHAWDWKFSDVTKSMEDIAKAGYSLVQVSPCQVCEDLSDNNSWWKLYQPYDYKFGNSLGSADEFKAMCKKADEYGISIIVDVVANHMAGTGGATCGERKPEVDSWWTDDKFHNTNIKFTGAFDTNREMMVRSNIGMPDVATEREDVQGRMIDYLKTMLDMGADGFRYDAAKHIGTTSDTGSSKDTFWKNISDAVAKIRPDALVYGEILNSMPVSDKWYVNDGIKVTESQKGWDMKDIVQGGAGKVSQKTAFTYTRESDANKLITWVENHDTYLNHWGSTGLSGNANYMSDEQIILAWSTVAARADAQALFFARPDGCSNPKDPGNPDASNTIAGSLGMSTKNFDWKDKRVAAVNNFKNAMVGVGEETSTQGGLAIIKRGNKGVVVTNFGDGTDTVSVSGLSGLKDGTYKCPATGKDIKVSGGNASISVDGKSFVVLYDASSVPAATTAPTTPAPTPTTVASETPVPGTVKISVSQESGTFEEAFDVTVKVENAAAAYYSYDGADWTKMDGSAKVKVGSEKLVGGDQVGLYVHAFDKDGKAYTKAYTYTKKAEGQATHKFCVRVKKSQFTTAPHVYMYDAAGIALAGKWPGTLMTAEGDYYVYTSDTFASASVMFSIGATENTAPTWRDPEDQKPGYDVTGYMEYDKDTKKVTAFTPEGVATGDKKPGAAPKAPAFVVATPGVTVTPATTPAIVADGPMCVTSVEEGTIFTTETLKVDLVLKNATSGTYSVDNGPEKEFKDKVTVELGQGKIADSEVTLQVKTTDGTKTNEQTFVYRKKFDQEEAKKVQKVTKVDPNTLKAASAVVKIQSLFEVIAEVAAAPAEKGGMYATNPDNKVGKSATITIDGDASDWSEDMLIAQCGAWDIANNWKGGHENCVLDSYALYAAWDDANLYLGWQMVNTTDTWANQGDGPLSDGGRVLDVPLMLALNVGNRKAMTGQMAGGKLIWDALDIKFDTRVDNILLMSGKVGLGTPGYFIASDDSGAASYAADYCLSFKTEGINYKMAETSIPKEIMMLDNSQSPDDAYDSSKYVDAMSKGHDRKYDSFYEINIPLKTLGIDKSYLETNGIGVMQISTRGTSGIDCIPHDPSMLDNVSGDCAVDPSTSHEKDDQDIITVPLAAVGNMKAGGEGSGGTLETPKPPTAAPTAEVTTTPVAGKETPVAGTTTPVVDVTTNPEVTAMPGEKQLVVNFGADKSAPQLAGTTLKLEAVPYNAIQGSQYQFALDGKVVQAYSEKATYDWLATGGEHTIQVTVVDSQGYSVTVEKKYTVEGEVQVTTTPDTTPNASVVETVPPVTGPAITVDPAQTQNPVTGPAVDATPVADATATPAADATATPAADATATPSADATVTPVPTANIPDKNQKQPVTARIKLSKTSPQKVSTSIVLTPMISGGSGKGYKYTMVVELKDGFTKTLASNVSVEKQKSVTWKPTKAGSYTISIIATDSEGNKSAGYKCTYVIKDKKLAITKAKVSKKTVKVKKTVKITAAGTAKKGTLKFKFVAKKGKKVTTIKKYSTKKTANWKPKKAGNYQVIIYAKDGSGKVVSKKIKVVVKK